MKTIEAELQYVVPLLLLYLGNAQANCDLAHVACSFGYMRDGD